MTVPLLAAQALATRTNPDAAEVPSGRIEAGTQLAEVERRGDWVRVETPSGDRWWVDGRRLATLADTPAVATAPLVATGVEPPPPPAPEPPPPPPPATGDEPPPPEPESAPTRRRILGVVIGVVLVAVVLGALGAVFLLPGDEAIEPPTVLRGKYNLSYGPEVVAHDSLYGSALLSDEVFTRMTQAGPGGSLELVTVAVPELRGVQAATFADLGDLAVLVSDPAVLEFDWNWETGTLDLIERVELPGGRYADVISEGPLNSVVVYPEVDGQSDSLMLVDLSDGTRQEFALDRPVRVTSAVYVDLLYTGHDQGVLVTDPIGFCEGRTVTTFDVGNAFVAAWHLDQVIALGRDTSSVTVIQPAGEEIADLGCNAVRLPEIVGTIPMGIQVGSEAAAVTMGVAAYVRTSTGDVLIVDIEDPASQPPIVISDLGGSLPYPGMIVYSPDAELDNYHVFVSDEDERELWWIAPDGQESRAELNPNCADGASVCVPDSGPMHR